MLVALSIGLAAVAVVALIVLFLPPLQPAGGPVGCTWIGDTLVCASSSP